MKPDFISVQEKAAIKSRIIVTVVLFMSFSVLLSLVQFLDGRISFLGLQFDLLFFVTSYGITFFTLRLLFKRGSLHKHAILKTIGLIILTLLILKLIVLFTFELSGYPRAMTNTPVTTKLPTTDQHQKGDFIDTTTHTYYNYTYQYCLTILEDAKIEHSDKSHITVSIQDKLLDLNIMAETTPFKNTSIWEIITDTDKYAKKIADTEIEDNLQMADVSVKKIHFAGLEAIHSKHSRHTKEEKGLTLQINCIQFIKKPYIYTVTIKTAISPSEKDSDHYLSLLDSFRLL